MSDTAIATMRQWAAEPWVFARQCLGVEPDDWQEETLRAIAAGHDLIALKASKGPGKSTLLSWIGWWFLVTKPRPKCVATSVSADNLNDGLWAEMAKWQAQSELLKRTFTWTASRIAYNDEPEHWWMSARTWPKSADATQQAQTLAGLHADHVLFLLDEAGGIPEAVLATAEAGMANADKAAGRSALIAMAGNPTQLDGALYAATVKHRGRWWVKEISGDPDDPKRAKRVSIEWARLQIATYGREHPYVLVNVFGKFPPGQDNALFAANDVIAATKRTLLQAEYIDHPKVLGVDVARFGDDRTVIAMRQGRVLYKLKTFRNLSTMEVAGQVAMIMETQRPAAVFIDQTGLGAGVVDRLKELQLRVTGIDSGSSPLSNRYLNRRVEMWANAAEWVKTGCLPDDGELVSELTSPTYSFRSDSKMQLESKKDLKARGKPSPDKADAFVLTFALPVAIPPPPGFEHQGHTVHEYDPLNGD